MKGRAGIPDPYGSKILWFLPHQAASGLYSKISHRQTSLAAPFPPGINFFWKLVRVCKYVLEGWRDWG